MLTIPDSVASAARSQSGQFAPSMFVDIFADTGPHASINAQAQWKAVNDPAIVNDLNVDFDRQPGSVVLAPSATVVHAAHTGTDALVATLSARLRRYDSYTQLWQKFDWTTGWRTAWLYNGSTYEYVTNNTAAYQTFTAAATQVINEMMIVAKYTGTSAMPVSARLIAVATGKQVGATVSFTPTAVLTQHTLTGFSAGAVAGRVYRLELIATPMTTVLPLPLKITARSGWWGAPNPPPAYIDNYCDIEIHGFDAPSPWRIPFGTVGKYFSTGGQGNYVASGTLHRTINVGAVPANDGVLSFSDIVPPGCSLQVDAYYTDSAIIAAESAITNWTLHKTNILSGETLTQHQYWRFVMALASNPANDLSPELGSIDVQFAEAPITLGTTAERSYLEVPDGVYLPLVLPLTFVTAHRLVQSGFKALNSVDMQSAQLSPQFQGSMIGGVRATCGDEPILSRLLVKPLRGKRVDVRVGYVGVSKTLRTYSGQFDDMVFGGGMYTIEISDHFKAADVSIPSSKAGPEWALSTAYSVNDKVVHGSSSYICTQAHTSTAATEPGVGASWASYWADNGTVWASIVYSSTTSPDSPSDWHLADIIADLLINHINIPSERIDFASINALKTRFPNRRGYRTVTKPTKATDLLGELAWLLEAQFVIRDGLFAIMPEALSTDLPVERITPTDIAPNSVRYRRGWRDMFNQAVLIGGYLGDGDGADKYTLGEVYADVTSQADYGTIIQKEWYDKWGLPSTEAIARMTSLVGKYSDGRRVVECSVSMRLVALEPGDVVEVASGQFPKSDPGPHKMIIIRKHMDWSKQSISLTMLEV